MIDKDKYILAKINGLLERLRGDEISHRISEDEYPLSAQIALLMDKDTKQAEWDKYQAFRSKVKAEVDAEFEEMELQIALEENTKKETADEA
jgi:hypothetical protein